MNCSTMLRAISIAAVALVVLAPSAFANPLTSPSGTAYTSTIKAEAEGSMTIAGTFVTVECKKSTLEGKVESHSTATAGGELSGWTFSECNYPVTVSAPGSLEVHASSGGNATVGSSWASIKISTSVGECVFTTNGTSIGTLTGSISSNATIDVKSVALPRTAGNFLCGSSGTWNGSYKVTTPSTLYVHPPVSPLTSPSGTPYTSTIKAEASGGIEFSFPFITMKCNKSVLEGQVNSHASTAAGIKLESLNFAECNYLTTAPKTGSLMLDATAGGNATATSNGLEINIAAGGECVYTTNQTHLGTLAGSNSSNAKLVVESAALPGKMGNPCGSSVVLSGTYYITTPSTLYMD